MEDDHLKGRGKSLTSSTIRKCLYYRAMIQMFTWNHKKTCKPTCKYERVKTHGRFLLNSKIKSYKKKKRIRLGFFKSCVHENVKIQCLNGSSNKCFFSYISSIIRATRLRVFVERAPTVKMISV